jgi:sulfate transport system ATP-binding protein
MGISVEQVSKHFGSFAAVEQVSLEIQTGSLVALLGPSGSGKSTLLRLIAGLEQPDNGKIFLNSKDVTEADVRNRGVGFVFQHYALFKHMTVRQNIGFGLELNKWSKVRIKNRVEELLDLVQMAGYGDRYPSQLSGGQRQRVALARSLATEPNVLLLDEPFGALDAKVRKDLRSWLHNLHRKTQVTTVFVTHDQEEAMEVADQIVVMNQGKVEQIGSPAEIYDNPATPFVMSFIGPVNVLPLNSGLLQNGSYEGASGHTLNAASQQVFLRPHDVEIALQPSREALPAEVQRVVHMGWEIQIELILESGQSINAYLSREAFDQLQLALQQQVYVKPKQIRVFEEGDRQLAEVLR